MKRMFASRGFKAILGTVLILFGLMLYTANTGGGVFSSLFGFLATPLQQLTGQLTEAAGDVLPGGGRTVEELERENEALQNKVNELNNALVDYYEIKKLNEQYVKYLDLPQKDIGAKFVPGRVISRDPADLFSGFVLDRGSLDGVSVDDPVITDKGLVGRVTAVSATFCRVTTLLSPENNVAAIDPATGDSGVITGNLRLADQMLTRMNYLTAQNKVKPGDIITTTGMGGVFPRDLLIGEVVEVKLDEADATTYAVVRPFEDLSTVSDVFIMTEFKGQGSVFEEGTPAPAQEASSAPAESGASSPPAESSGAAS